jgi:hypothetical protein
MLARLTMLAPRLAALVLIWLLAAASLTFAAGGGQGEETPVEAPAEAAAEKPEVLVVPDVRRQTYVFAKGILQDGGFAWRVEGPVKGYAANLVSGQDPAPGTRVVDNGAPTVVVRLERNADYPERGLPENASDYRGTPIVLLRDWHGAETAEPAVETGATETSPATTTSAETTVPTETAPAPEPAPPTEEPQPATEEPEPAYRAPDFVVPGAPREPGNEMPLPERARLVERRLSVDRKPGRWLVGYWLYQHGWVVTGASFGWKDGDRALRILIRLDERLEREFGFGAKSAAVARRTLAQVERKKA